MADRAPVWERVVVGVGSVVIAAVMLSVYAKLDELGMSMAVMQAQLADLRTSKSGYYRRSEAKAAQEAIWRTDKDQYERLADHEQRLRHLEARR